MEKLQEALKILSDAEKQLRLSSERPTWFTAALLQLGSSNSPQPTSHSSSQRSVGRSVKGAFEKTKDASSSENKSHPLLRFRESSPASVPGITYGHSNVSASRGPLDTDHKDDVTGVAIPRCVSPDKLDVIWRRCIEKCDSRRLRHLLYAHGKLVSITEIKGRCIIVIH